MSTQVRMRPYWAQWRYKLDVLVDQEPIYFDRYPQKIQHFPGVTVYTPSNILNQSHVIAMFQVITVHALGALGHPFRTSAKLWTPPSPPCLYLARIFSRINQPPILHPPFGLSRFPVDVINGSPLLVTLSRRNSLF